MYIRKDGFAMLLNGKLVYAKDPMVIELEVRGTCFGAASQFTAYSSTSPNEMYIDANDGTGIHTFPITNTIEFEKVYFYYQNLADPSKIGTIDRSYNQRRKVRVSFKYPSKINALNIVSYEIFGKFPEALGNYNFTSQLNLSSILYIDEFPSSFRGVNTNLLSLNLISQSTVTIIPEWIYNSKIKSLAFQNGFSFLNIPSATNLDKLINIVGLETLSIQGTGANSFPTNWKDITTLKNLAVGNSTFTTLSSNISNISQLEKLTISAGDGSGYNNVFNNWGIGIDLMTNLKTLNYVFCADTLTTNIPTGAENCWKLKTINCGGSLNSIARTDAHLTAWYNCATTYGDITATSNNKFRGVSFSIYFQLTNSKRPTGIYQQPTGYIQGSNNGSPFSVMEMIYVLVKQYKWVVTILNSAGTGSEILAP